MAERKIALQARDARRRENVPDEPFSLLEVEAVAVVGDDARRVLPTVLDGDQAVVDLAHRAWRADDADEPAHQGTLRERRR